MAAEARKNLSAFPNLQLEVGDFESVAHEPEGDDLVVAATSFHRIEQLIGYQRVTEALRPGGNFAKFQHHHVWSPETDRFYYETQKLYLKYDSKPPDLRLPIPNEIEILDSEIASAGFFLPAVAKGDIQNIAHTPASFTDLLLAFSFHIASPMPDRSSLIEALQMSFAMFRNVERSSLTL